MDLFFVYKAGAQTRLRIDLEVKEALIVWSIKYLFTTCPSDNYLFHENFVIKCLLKNTPAPPPPW